MEPEIVSIAPTDPVNKTLVAQKQQEAQLATTQRDLEQFLPVALDARDAFLKLFLEALETSSPEEKEPVLTWIRKHFKDAAQTVSSLNNVVGTIVKPAQVQGNTRKFRRYAWKNDKGTEEITEEVEVTGTTPEA